MTFSEASAAGRRMTTGEPLARRRRTGRRTRRGGHPGFPNQPGHGERERPMNIADELRKLQELHRSGALSDEEFARAKAAVLYSAPSAPGPVPPDTNPDSVDPQEALTPQRLRVMQIIAGTVVMGVVVFLAVALFL